MGRNLRNGALQVPLSTVLMEIKCILMSYSKLFVSMINHEPHGGYGDLNSLTADCTKAFLQIPTCFYIIFNAAISQEKYLATIYGVIAAELRNIIIFCLLSNSHIDVNIIERNWK